MQITIKIKCDNAAFEDCAGSEVARILRKYADSIEGMEPEDGPLHDVNGNRVGQVDILD
jgi:hypothetical protein